MTKNIITLFLSFFWLIVSVSSFAAPISYDEYRKEATRSCESGKPWYSEKTRNAQTLLYPELNNDSIRAWINMQIERAEPGTPLRETLLWELSPVRLWLWGENKILHIIQVVYHARMNTVFDCAVIESRKNIIEILRNTSHWQSEILEKIKKEEISLNQKAKQCIPKDSTIKPWESSIDTSRNRLIDTTVLQYCHYRHYLTYLESHIQENISEFNKLNDQIGNNSEGHTVYNSDSLQTHISNQWELMRKEIYIADRAITRAVRVFKEMERTYAAHLILLVIYDDYVRLRDNLDRYMSSTSQLLEKAYNAMSR